jgi:hypothetical protein
MDRMNLLWIDDDLHPDTGRQSDERRRLEIWLRYFRTPDRCDRIRIIEVRDLASLRSELQRRFDKPAGHPDHIDAFLVDLLWKTNRESGTWTFGELDPAFSREKVKHLDAGAQLIGLMRNREFRNHRPDWLRAFEGHPIAILTTLIDHHETVDRYVDDEVRATVQVLIKDRSRSTGAPDDTFCKWVELLKRRSDPASSTS